LPTFEVARPGPALSAVPPAAVIVADVAHRAAEPGPEDEATGVEIVEISPDHAEQPAIYAASEPFGKTLD
jgi:hypothetical protein